MPPNTQSRYRDTLRVKDGGGLFFLTPRKRFLYRELTDSRSHTVVEGETLEALADRFFPNVTNRPCGLYWIIGDFQPVPILDATIALPPGSTVVIPSSRTARFVLSRSNRK